MIPRDDERSSQDPSIVLGNFTLFLTTDISLHPDLYDTNMIRSTPLSQYGDDPGLSLPETEGHGRKTSTAVRARGSIRQLAC
jgi:hypothetical protein